MDDSRGSGDSAVVYLLVNLPTIAILIYVITML